ncbi:MAG: glycosyltransferase family 9 protein [Candidatus Paceibacterota bacterium]|jgi:ADP-heptose:LPS heptosyltransferase
MIVTTAMFRAVKRSYPRCRLTVIGNAINRRVLEGNPDVDEYIVWEDVPHIIEKLKNNTYDFGCVTVVNFHSLAALYLAGIKTIVAPVIRDGWSPYETRPYKIIRNFVIPKDHHMRQYVPREYLRLLEPIGIYTEDTKKYIYWTPTAERKAKEIVSSPRRQYALRIGIMSGAGNTVKQWEPKKFSQVADYLVEQYNAHIFSIGSELNRKENDEMIAHMRHSDCVTDTLGTSVDEVKALVSLMDLTVSVDTGPIFIAEASGVPTIDITGAIDVHEMAPRGEYHLVVPAKDGEPQIWTMNATVYDHVEARRQIDSISVQMVVEAVDILIAKIEKKRLHA